MKSTINDEEADLPKVIFFKASTLAVQNKESFSLSWKVENATMVEIYKNGISIAKHGADKTTLAISESYDGKDREIEYSLIASNDVAQTRSLPIFVSLTDAKNKQLAVPEIISFSSSASNVQNKESFTLSWQVDNATDIDLYRNGMVFRKLGPDKTSLTISESYDGKDKEIVYTLIALNGTEQVESNPVKVLMTGKNEKIAVPPVPRRPEPAAPPEDTSAMQMPYQVAKERNLKKILVYLWATLLVVIVALVVVVYYFQSRPKVLDFDPKEVFEGHTIVIVGKNFPKDSAQLRVLFNNVPGSIQYHSNDLIRVVVPVLGDHLGDGKVTVGVVIEGDSVIASTNLLVKQRLAVQDVHAPVVDSSIVITEAPKKAVVKKLAPKTKRNVVQIDSSRTAEPPPSVVPVEPRKVVDIYKLVKVTSNEFKRKTFGGVKDLELTVQNDSPYDIDNVHVEISYLKKRNERKIKNETVVFSGVRAHTTSSKKIPDNNRGAKVEFKIIQISSKQLDADLKR